MSSTESRLAAVERQLCFHRAAIVSLLVALVALVGYGATEGLREVVRARVLEMVNEKGRVLARLAESETPFSGFASGRLELFNTFAATVFGVGADSGAAFSYKSTQGTERSSIPLASRCSAGTVR